MFSLIVLFVQLISVNAEPIRNNEYITKLHEIINQKDGREQFTNLILSLLNGPNGKPKPNVVEDINEKTTLILSKFSRTLDDLASEPNGLESRALLSLSNTIWLNERVKYVIDFLFVNFESTIGKFVLHPVRHLVDVLINRLLPCGVECTLLA